MAIAETLKGLTELLEDNDVETVFGMLIDREALGDRSAEVRAKMLEVRLLPCIGLHRLKGRTGGHRRRRHARQSKSPATHERL